MNQTRWMVIACAISVASFASHHPLGGEGSTAAEVASGIGALSLLALVMLATLTVVGRVKARQRRSTARTTASRVADRTAANPT